MNVEYNKIEADSLPVVRAATYYILNGRTTLLSMTQPIFRGGKTIADTKAAQANIQAQRAALADTEQSVLLQTVTTYADLVRDLGIVDARRNNVRVLMQQLEATRERFRVGELTITDVSQSEARLEQAKADLVLETPADILKGGESGPAVVPRKGAESLLLKVAAHQLKPFMPPKDNKAEAVSRKDVTQEILEESCPKCSKPLANQLGRRGRFIGCSSESTLSRRKHKSDALELIGELKDKVKELSLRTLIQVTKIRKAAGDNWKNLAEYTICG